MKNIKVLTTIIGLLIFSSSHLIADTFPDLPPTDLKPPRYKKSVKPKYPKDARRAEKEGKVILTATIDANGIPQDVVALTNLGYGFEEAAIEAFKKATFSSSYKSWKTGEF